MTITSPAPALSAALLFAGCAAVQPTPASPQDAFWAALSSHCGKAYAGGMTTADAADAELAGSAMVIAVTQCSDQSIAVPFHVQRADGTWDRSRTWLITRTAAGLRLKHDHRHADGSPDPVTFYGGDTAAPGTASAQSFPVDADSIAMFRREGLTASLTNVWSVEVDPAGTPGGTYAYQLRRTIAGGAPAERHFRVVFDLTKPVALPPPAWGWWEGAARHPARSSSGLLETQVTLSRNRKSAPDTRVPDRRTCAEVMGRQRDMTRRRVSACASVGKRTRQISSLSPSGSPDQT